MLPIISSSIIERKSWDYSDDQSASDFLYFYSAWYQDGEVILNYFAGVARCFSINLCENLVLGIQPFINGETGNLNVRLIATFTRDDPSIAGLVTELECDPKDVHIRELLKAIGSNSTLNVRVLVHLENAKSLMRNFEISMDHCLHDQLLDHLSLLEKIKGFLS